MTLSSYEKKTLLEGLGFVLFVHVVIFGFIFAGWAAFIKILFFM